MSLKDTIMQTTREAFSAPKRNTFTAPTLLPGRCICGLIRGETGLRPDREGWITQRTYRLTRGVNHADFPLTHTCCQKCFTDVEPTVRPYSREIGTPP